MRHYTSLGKEVLCGVIHIADCCSPDQASDVARALNILEDIREGEREPVMPELLDQPMPLFDGHAIRQEGDEYACKCGKRWGVDEGEEHP